VSSPKRPQALLPRIDVGHPVSVQATLNISLNVKEFLGTRGAKRYAPSVYGAPSVQLLCTRTLKHTHTYNTVGR